MLDYTTFLGQRSLSVVVSRVSKPRVEAFVSTLHSTGMPFGAGNAAINDPKLRVVPSREVTVLS